MLLLVAEEPAGEAGSGIQFLPCLFLKLNPAKLSFMADHDYFFYIMASKRVFEHKNYLIEGFTKNTKS